MNFHGGTTLLLRVSWRKVCVSCSLVYSWTLASRKWTKFPTRSPSDGHERWIEEHCTVEYVSRAAASFTESRRFRQNSRGNNLAAGAAYAAENERARNACSQIRRPGEHSCFYWVVLRLDAWSDWRACLCWCCAAQQHALVSKPKKAWTKVRVE